MSDESLDPKKRRLRLAFVIAVLIGALILLFAVEWGSLTGQSPAPPPAPVQSGAAAPADATPVTAIVPARGPIPVRAFAARPAAPERATPDERSPLADGLNAADGSAQRDVAIVANLLACYLEQFRELPVGNNAEITAALAGDNARGYAVLPPEHRAISPAGELLDRWSTPYFFHQLAGDRMEVRSAGPDRRRYTGDDVLWPAPGLAAGEPATLAGTQP